MILIGTASTPALSIVVSDQIDLCEVGKVVRISGVRCEQSFGVLQLRLGRWAKINADDENVVPNLVNVGALSGVEASVTS